MLRMQTVVLQ